MNVIRIREPQMSFEMLNIQMFGCPAIHISRCSFCGLDGPYHTMYGYCGMVAEDSFENQRYRASGLNLVTSAIVLWNTIYLERAVQTLKTHGHPVDSNLIQHLSPLSWEHINLTSDYIWRQNHKIEKGKFRPLQSSQQP